MADENRESIRALPFEVVSSGDGQTLEGYAAVLNTPTHIRDWAGEYDEVLMPGVFSRSLKEKTPTLLFEHGMHPLIGNLPLGVIQDISPDSKGYHIRARISDNWLMQPVRDAIRDGAISGMSVRFNFDGIKKGYEESRRGETRMRTVHDANLKELGPVVFPAYALTTASVRSILDRLPDTERSDVESDPGDKPSPDEQPGNGPSSQQESQLAMQARDRELRIRRIIRE